LAKIKVKKSREWPSDWESGLEMTARLGSTETGDYADQRDGLVPSYGSFFLWRTCQQGKLARAIRERVTGGRGGPQHVCGPVRDVGKELDKKFRGRR